MIQLPNGCRRSDFHVFPNNWQTTKAKLTETWYADCRFTDSRFITGYLKEKTTLQNDNGFISTGLSCIYS
ncbi:hypothetical protein [Ginsengibacter hankyongi]|uniref:hypothetical protein n=1 Tax=Ginsengibacter hankyongi TaxID=2607284 RepID=UPI00123DD0A2|nr:hypothetical protein [Ginsengibacter hankyongi]